MNKFADLHMHTYFSDGTDSPEQVIEKSIAAGLACISITDHDTISGFAPTMEAAKAPGIEVISGVELSTVVNGREVHLLGYCMDCSNKALVEHFVLIKLVRESRMRKIIDKLSGLGVKGVSLEEVMSEANVGTLGRPHLASVMVRKGVVGGIQQAFDKYLAEGAPAFVDEFKTDIYEAIKLIRQAGGVAVLAHPMVTLVDEMIPSFVEAGLGGIEAFYPNHPENIMSFYQGLAKKHGLLVTGGSDAHGARKKNTYIGKMRIPYEYVELLKAKALKG